MPTTEEKIRWRHSNDEKVDILQQYTNWVAAGKPHGKSPSTALAAKYNCHYNYPKELFDKVLFRMANLQVGRRNTLRMFGK